jgi:hypothetical protein
MQLFLKTLLKAFKKEYSMNIRNSLRGGCFYLTLFLATSVFALDSVSIKRQLDRAWKNAQSAWLQEKAAAESLQEDKFAQLFLEMANPWVEVLTNNNSNSQEVTPNLGASLVAQLVDRIFYDDNIIQTSETSLTYKIRPSLCGIFAKLCGDTMQEGPSEMELSCNEFLTKNSLTLIVTRKHDNNLYVTMMLDEHKVITTVFGNAIMGQDIYFVGLHTFIEAARNEIPKFVDHDSWLQMLPAIEIAHMTGAISWRFSYGDYSPQNRASLFINILEPIACSCSLESLGSNFSWQSSPPEHPTFALNVNHDSHYSASLNLGAIEIAANIFLDRVTLGRVQASLSLINNNLRLDNLSIGDKLYISMPNCELSLEVNASKPIEKILYESGSAGSDLYLSPFSFFFKVLSAKEDGIKIDEMLTMIFSASAPGRLVSLTFIERESAMRHEAHGEAVVNKLKMPENITTNDLFIPALGVTTCESNSIFKLGMGEAHVSHEIIATQGGEELAHEKSELDIPENWSLNMTK